MLDSEAYLQRKFEILINLFDYYLIEFYRSTLLIKMHMFNSMTTEWIYCSIKVQEKNQIVYTRN